MLKHASPIRSSTHRSCTPLSSAPSQTSTSEDIPCSTNSLILHSRLTPSHLSTNTLPSCLGMSPLTTLPTAETTSERFNERGVDCEGLVPSPTPRRSALTGDMDSVPSTGWGIGPVITQGRAIVRRGLSFTLRRESDVNSVRSVKSEGQTSSTVKNTDNLSTEKRQDKIFQNTVQSCVKSSHKITQPPSEKLTDLENSHDSDPLRSLLQMPGIHAEVRLPNSAVTSSPTILNPDTMSLNSADSLATASSGRTSSRSWGSSAAASTSSQSSEASSTENTSTTLRIFAKCLRSDIEYKTVSVSPRTTCGDLVSTLLSKYRMKHRDPNLFYLTMEVTVKMWKAPPCRSLLVLEEKARPAQLILCRPPGDARFALQMRKGGVIRVHDTVLMPGSQYKSLLVSYRTTAEEVVQLMLNCYSRSDARNFYALHKVCRSPNYRDERLDRYDRPLQTKVEWTLESKEEFVFVLRRNMSTALSLRKLSEQSWSSGSGAGEGRGSSARSSSASKCSSSSSGKEFVRPRCHSVPAILPDHHTSNSYSLLTGVINNKYQHQQQNESKQHPYGVQNTTKDVKLSLPPVTNIPTPPPRSRHNINHIHPSLLTLTPQHSGSSNTDHNSAPYQYNQINNNHISNPTNGYITNRFMNQTSSFNKFENYYQERVLTHNNVNYNNHFRQHPEEEMATVIDCTMATPIMSRASGDVHRRIRSLSASRLPSALSIPPSNGNNVNNNNNPYHPRSVSPKTITWIEKTWTTTGCQTILSYTPKHPSDRPHLFKPSMQTKPTSKTKSSHTKHVNFVDEPQIEGDQPRLSRFEKVSTHPNSVSQSNTEPPPIPPPPISENSSASSSPEPPPPPSVSPPPLTPPTVKKVAINEVVLMEPPLSRPNKSPPPLTPEPPKIIKPCIKYPKSSHKSHSAPSSPALGGGRYYGPHLSIPPVVPPPPTEEALTDCPSHKVCSTTDDIKIRQKHTANNCEHNCRNCFYI